MKLLDFNTVFPNAESCKEKFKERREEDGIICAK